MNNLKGNPNPSINDDKAAIAQQAAFAKIQAQKKQQENGQQELNMIVNRRMVETKTNITDIISEEQFEQLKTLIEVQFGRQPSQKYKVSHQDYLELYVRIFEEKETVFNLIEWGIISDMLFVDFPLKPEYNITVKDFLEFKAEMMVLPTHFHNTKKDIDKFANNELESKVKNKIISL